MISKFFKLMLQVLILLAGSVCLGQSIFVWENDNALRIRDPEFNALLTSTMSLTRTMDQLLTDYTRSRELPENLDEYDVMVTSLSFNCPG